MAKIEVNLKSTSYLRKNLTSRFLNNLLLKNRLTFVFQVFFSDRLITNKYNNL